jgi:hypothetical protein
MKLAAQWYVQGGQRGGSVAAAAAMRRLGSGKSHVSGWGVAAYVSATEWKVRVVAGQAAWPAVLLWAGGPGGAARLFLPGRLGVAGLQT